jgi:hypothetical protein
MSSYEQRRQFAQSVLRNLTSDERWAFKQELASPSRYYGDGGTIHNTTTLDIDTDKDGNVIAVWFRCQLLAFNQVRCDDRRTEDLRGVQGARLSGVEVCDHE